MLSVGQDAESWLDVGACTDAVFYIDVRSVTKSHSDKRGVPGRRLVKGGSVKASEDVRRKR